MQQCTLLALLFIAACSNETDPPAYAVDANCRDTRSLVLAPGAFAVLDPAEETGCIVLPGQAAASSYVGVVFSANGEEFSTGITGDALLSAGAPTAAGGVPTALRAAMPPTLASRFHANLRKREMDVARRAGARRDPARARTDDSIVVGEARAFQACANYECSTYREVGAVARYVGKSIAVFVDTLAPGGGLGATDIASLGALFDEQLFVIDTTAFGSPTDIDGNRRVVALLTVAVNQLVPNCNAEGIVLGYFNGTDLVPSEPGSNAGEVFYGLLPDPANPQCTVSYGYVMNQLPRTFIHEFQHLISFGQHVVQRGGPPEQTWLNEGLSHYAEELGGRRVADGGAAPGSRYDEFAFTDLDNAYGYLLLPERYFLVVPTYSSGTPEERGAMWLLVRWLADQYAATGHEDDVTRRLLGTGLVGAANVEGLTGEAFADVLAKWHLATWADELPGIPAVSPLQYKSLQLRTTFLDLHQRDPGRFPRAYPLTPDVVGTDTYARSFTLRGGSGMFFRYDAPAGAVPYRLQLSGADSSSLPALARPRIAILRLN